MSEMPPQPERIVLLRTVFNSISSTWNDWTNHGIDAAIEYATKRQAEGGARPMEVIEAEVVRRVSVRTSVELVEDTGVLIRREIGETT